MSKAPVRPYARLPFDCSAAVEPSMTKQAFKEECDINRIMAKYAKTGLIEFSNDLNSGRYVDLPSEMDFHTSMNRVIAAQTAFDSLSSKIRDTFDNDPAKFLAFVGDPKNYDKALELGVVVRRPEVASTEGGKGDGTSPTIPQPKAAEGASAPV